ncbi:MAG: hypothetical protein IJD82_11110 [Clostridia bacterium]|nr:hypothetical protein [Clostridia bacterium]
MHQQQLRNRITGGIGLAVLAILTAALIYAFSQELLPYQDDGDVFGTVYVSKLEEDSSAVS